MSAVATPKEATLAAPRYHREGEPVAGPVFLNDKGRHVTVIQQACGRCGGEGGSVKWERTGYTCYQCSGARFFNRTVPAYTEAELEKLNARRDKLRARKAAERAQREKERRAEVAAARDANRAAFEPEHPDILEYLDRKDDDDSARNEFTESMRDRLCEHGELTEKQVDALREMMAREAFREWQRRQERYLWEPGQRVEATIVWQTVRVFKSRDFRFGDTYLHIGKYQGATVIYKGSKSLVDWKVIREPGFPTESIPVVPVEVDLRFTVKCHDNYNGTPQTIISRPKEIEPPAGSPA